MQGHRYCEPGVREPDQHNDKLWLYHYPYDEPINDAADAPLLAAFNRVADGVYIDTAYPKYKDLEKAMYGALEPQAVTAQFGCLDPLFGDVIGPRVKVFYPQVPLHEKIRDKVLEAYISDLDAASTPYGLVQNNCHGVSGNYWIASRDIAVENVKDFCGQGEKTVIYNKGSANELSLTVRNLQDDSKGPNDSPDCVQRFQGAVIDGCDGNDPVNNPHNYKYGSTLTTGDGWVYSMTPLSRQVKEDSCDVWYKFWCR